MRLFKNSLSFIFLSVFFVTTASATTYYSQGSLAPNLTSSWNSITGGGGTTPTGFTTADVFVVQFGHTMTTTASWTVSGTSSQILINGGALILAHNTSVKYLTLTDGNLTVNAGVTLTVDNGNLLSTGEDLYVGTSSGTCILTNYGTITFINTAIGKISNVGTYHHAQNGGTIPVFAWTSFSTCKITGVTTTLPAGLGQSFGNIIYDCPSQTSNVVINPAPTSITNFTINSTGTGSLVLGYNIAPSTSLKINGGILDLSNFTANGFSLADSIVVGSGVKLRIGGTNSFPLNYNAYRIDRTSTVEYYGTAAQTIAAKKYGNLFISGTRIGNITFSNTDTIHIAGAFSSSATFAGGGYITTGSTVDYNGTGSQTVARGKYGNLCISGIRETNNITFDNIDTIHIAGTFSPKATFSTGGYVTAGSTFDFNGTVAQTIPAFLYNNISLSGSNRTGNISFSNSGTIGIAGTFTPAASFSTGGYSTTGSTVDYNGFSSQIVPAFSYYNLIISNTATNTVTSSMGGTLFVNNVLTVSGVGLLAQFNDTISAGQVLVSATGSLELLYNSFLVVNNGNTGGNDLIVDGLLKNKGVIRYNNGTGQVNGIYDHAKDGDTIPAFNWANGSLCTVTGTYGTTSLYGLNQNFYNFTYDCIQMSVMNFNSQLRNVIGTCTIQSTGSGSLVLFNSNATLNVGDFSLISGTVDFCSNTGVFDTIRVNNIGGSLFQNGGSTITMSGSGGQGTLHFVNAGQSAYTAGTIGGPIGYRVSNYLHAAGIITPGPFVVDQGAKLYVEGESPIVGTGSFLLNSGATLEVKNPDGFSSFLNSGAIQVSGSRSYSTGASYQYTALSIQQTGDGLPDSVSSLIIKNPGGVILTYPVTVTDTLNIVRGQFNTAGNTLNIAGTLKLNSGSTLAGTAPTYYSGSTLVYASGGIFDRGVEWSSTSGPGYPYNVSVTDSVMLDLGANGGSNIALQLGGDLTIQSGSTLLMNGSGNEMTAPLNIVGSIYNHGQLFLSSKPGGDITERGNWTNTGIFVPNNSGVIFNGTSKQYVHGTQYFHKLTIDNPNDVQFDTNLVIQDSLILTNGRLMIQTANKYFNRVNLSDSAVVHRINGYVVGELGLPVHAGSDISVAFPIGNAHYAPVEIAFPSVSNSGFVLAITDTLSVMPANSGFRVSKKVNRYWNIIESGFTHSPSKVTLNYDVSDIDAGADPNKFYIKTNSEIWYPRPVISARTVTSTQAYGITNFRPFYVGELELYTITPTVHGNGTISPAAATNVLDGDTLSFAFAPSSGSAFDSLRVDAVAIDSTTGYTFENVAAPHTIDAYFSVQDATPPNPPQNLSAAAGDHYAVIRWQANSETDFKQYYIYGGTSPNPTAIVDSTTNIYDTLKTYGGLTNYSTYYFRIAAADTNGNISSFSNEVAVTPVDQTAPAAPTLNSAVAGNSQVTLQWNKSVEADFGKYRLYFDYTSPAVTLHDSISVSSDTVKIVKNLLNGSYYHFRITAVDSAGNASGFSNELSAMPIGDSVYTRVEFHYGYQPNGTTDLVNGVLNKHGVLYSVKNYPALNTNRAGFNFANDSVVGVVSDFYFYNDPPYANSIFANNGIGGIFPLGFAAYNYVTTAPAFPSGYTTAGGEVEKGKVYIIVTKDGLNYAKISIDRIDTISVAGKPATPYAFSISGGDRQISTFWFANEEYDVVKYRIYSGSDPNSMTLIDSTMSRTDTTKVIMGLMNNVLKYYRIAAVDYDGNESTISDAAAGFPVDFAAPNAPQNLNAVAGDGQVTIHWNANTEPDFQKYYIYRGNAANAEVLFDSAMSISDTLKIYTGLINYQEYFFRVSATDSDGNGSAFSNEVMVMPADRTAPSAPKNLAVTDSAANYFSIAWDKNTEGDIAKYYIYRDTIPNSALLVDSTLSAVDTVRSFTGLIIGKKYYFTVAAVDVNGNVSAQSNEVSAVPFMAYGIYSASFGNGTISPAGSTFVNHGDSIVFLINAAEHHHIDSLVIDPEIVTVTDFASNERKNIGTSFLKYRSKIVSPISINNSAARSPVVINGIGNDDTLRTYSFTNVTEGHTINAYFSKNTYLISPSVVGNGTILSVPDSTVEHGGTISFYIIPDPYQHVDSVVVDGIKTDSTVSYSFVNVTAPHAIQAFFSPNSVHHFVIALSSGIPVTDQTAGQIFQITTTAVDSFGNIVPGFNGNVWFSSSDSTVVWSGGACSVSFTNGEHGPQNVTMYHAGLQSILVIDSISGATGMSAVFAVHPAGLHSFAVTDTLGADIPTQIQAVPFPIRVTAHDEFGNVQTDFARPVNVSVPGAAVATGDGLTSGFVNGVLAEHLMKLSSYGIYSIAVVDTVSGKSGSSNVFGLLPSLHDITATSYNGTFSPAGVQPVMHGDTITFVFTPLPGHRFDSLRVDGQRIADSAWQYTFTNVTADHSIDAYFSPKVYTIASSAVNGSIFPGGNNTVLFAGDITLIFAPDAHNHFDSLIVDGELVADSVSQYTFTNVSDSHSIIVYYSPDTYSIVVNTFGNGSVTPAGLNVHYGDSAEFIITPDARHHIDSVLIDGFDIGKFTAVTLLNINTNHTLDCYFSPNLNVPPVFSLVMADTAIARFDTLRFRYKAIDPDSGTVRYEIVSSPAGAVIDSVSGQLLYLPAVNANGVYSIIVKTYDDSLTAVVDTAFVRVNIYGDVSGNGTISAFDGALVLQDVVSAIAFTSLQRRVGDVSGNGSISSLDASYILQRVVGLISSFPGGLGKQEQTEAVLSAFAFRIEKREKKDEYDLIVSVNKPSQVFGVAMNLSFDSTVVQAVTMNKTALTDSMSMAYHFPNGSANLALAALSPLNTAGDIIKFTFILKDPNYPKNARLFTMKKFMLNETDHTNDIGDITLNVRDLAQLPTVYKLEQNFPNPFNPSTTINYQLPTNSKVSLKIYDILGREVAALVNEGQSAGMYSTSFNSTQLAGGVYFYRIDATSTDGLCKRFIEVKKMVYLK